MRCVNARPQEILKEEKEKKDVCFSWYIEIWLAFPPRGHGSVVPFRYLGSEAVPDVTYGILYAPSSSGENDGFPMPTLAPSSSRDSGSIKVNPPLCNMGWIIHDFEHRLNRVNR